MRRGFSMFIQRRCRGYWLEPVPGVSGRRRNTFDEGLRSFRLSERISLKRPIDPDDDRPLRSFHSGLVSRHAQRLQRRHYQARKRRRRALLGMFLRAVLPERHLSADSKETIRLGG